MIFLLYTINMELEVQRYLRAKSLPQLNEEFAIKYKFSKKYPNLVLLSYSSDSPMEEVICQESRGLILDVNDDWKIVSMAFKAFFNVGNSNAPHLNWNDVRVYTKHDGTLISLYRYNNEWLVSTTGGTDASGLVSVHDRNSNIKNSDITFADLFWQVFRERGYKLPTNPEIEHGQMRYTYMFELETPMNRIVVDHKENNLTLLGARDLNTLQEINPEPIAEYFGWDCVKTWDLKDVQSMKSYLDDLDTVSMEGFVIVDSEWNRLKLKSEKYVLLHHVVGGLSKKSMVDIILKREEEECRPIFKEVSNLFEEMLEAVERLKEYLEAEYLKYKDIKDQKEFAEALKNHEYRYIFYIARNSKITPSQALYKPNKRSTFINYIEPWLPKNFDTLVEKQLKGENNG